jgi:hypothetical protein
MIHFKPAPKGHYLNNRGCKPTEMDTLHPNPAPKGLNCNAQIPSVKPDRIQPLSGLMGYVPHFPWAPPTDIEMIPLRGFKTDYIEVITNLFYCASEVNPPINLFQTPLNVKP